MQQKYIPRLANVIGGEHCVCHTPPRLLFQAWSGEPAVGRLIRRIKYVKGSAVASEVLTLKNLQRCKTGVETTSFNAIKNILFLYVFDYFKNCN